MFLIFQTPTGRVYYEKLVDHFNWSTEPNLVRFKVNNMQRSYYKTLEWRQATIESGDYDDEMIKGRKTFVGSHSVGHWGTYGIGIFSPTLKWN